eukprot:TRINITY_DN5797_c0_g1_i2.p1 TRINITY_DN5797_c0_g1~~TRINITY_DN5797_c0_g1_i2.p1  ORF type:complete len:547 (-),score=140.03 TRINITY_DN5797_c0_g1_i2:310-1950(-)
MRLKVSIQGQVVILPLPSDQGTVRELKDKIIQRVPNTPKDFDLFLEGGKIFDDDTLASLGIKDDDLLTDNSSSGSASSPGNVAVAPPTSAPSAAAPPPSSSDPISLSPLSLSSPSGVIVCNKPRDIDEIIMVVYDISGSMETTFTRIDDAVSQSAVSRLAASKICFGAFIDKTIAYEFSHTIGLICFGQNVTLKLPFVTDLDTFEQVIGDIDKTEPATNLFQAVGIAIDYIVEKRKELPNKPTCRIICFTDGEDTSGKGSYDVAVKAIKNSITVDGVLIGGSDDSHTNLRCLVHSSGGKSIRIPEKEDALSVVFEREDIISLAKRAPLAVKPSVPSQGEYGLYGQLALYPCITVEVEVKKKEPAPVPTVKSVQVTDPTALEKKVVAQPNQSRILKEYRQLLENPVASFTVFISEDQITNWKAIHKGLAGTPYEGGNWVIEITFPSTYPFSAPKINFLTPIYHLNFSGDRTCLDSSASNWSPAKTITTVLQELETLMREPNLDNALDAWKASLCRTDKPKYHEEIKKHTKDNASASLEDLKKQYNLD